MFSRLTSCSKNLKSVFFADVFLLKQITSESIDSEKLSCGQQACCLPDCCSLSEVNGLDDGVAHSVNTHFECCCWNTFCVSFPLGKKNTMNTKWVSQGEMRHFTSDAAQLVSATAATLSWCISSKGRKVVDIVLLLQQQHNNEIFTSFLTRRTWRRLVFCPLFSPPFSVPAVLCTLHLCKYSHWC